MANAVINGINIYCETYGSGPLPLVLAQGGFDSTAAETTNLPSSWVWEHPVLRTPRSR